MTLATVIAANLAEVKQHIAEACSAASRSPASVALVAVGKGHPADHARAALLAGQREFGENRVQEAEGKWVALKQEFPDTRLHLIGPLQRNKVRAASALFDMIETVDRPQLARALADEFARRGRTLDCLVQVNTGEEPQKAGVLPGDADAFIRACRDELALPVHGLMCIPPVDVDPGPHFALLRDLAERNGLVELSMGMSADFPIAIRYGATIVRVGSAIFGTRAPAVTAG